MLPAVLLYGLRLWFRAFGLDRVRDFYYSTPPAGMPVPLDLITEG